MLLEQVYLFYIYILIFELVIVTFVATFLFVTLFVTMRKLEKQKNTSLFGCERCMKVFEDFSDTPLSVVVYLL